MYESGSPLKSKVNVTLHAFPEGFCKIAKDSVGYAVVKRETARIENIIEEALQNSACSLNKAALLYAAEVFRDAMLQLVRKGKAVDVFGMGTIVIKADSGMESVEAGASEGMKFTTSFVSSQMLNKAVEEIEAGSELQSEREPVIETATDYDTMKTDGTLTAGKFAEIRGRRLRVEGEGAADSTGVYIVPCDRDTGLYKEDRSDWVRVKEEDVADSKPKTAVFKVPRVAAGYYRIAVRTKYMRGSIKLYKSAVEGVSDEVFYVRE